MITILHGENKLASRKALTEKVRFFKEKGGEVVKINGKKTNLTEIKQACESYSLFKNKRLVVIENFYSRPASNEKTTIQNYLKILPNNDINLIFWEEKQLTPASLRKLPPQTKAYIFKIQPVIFKFLDSLRPGNVQFMLNLLLLCYESESAERIFHMLCRQIRLLIIARNLGKKGLNKMPFWMQNKFLRQSQYFSLEKLLQFHQKLLQIDYEQKTGQAIMPLSFQLDLLIISL